MESFFVPNVGLRFYNKIMGKKNFLISIPLICFLVSCSPEKASGYYRRNVECETYEEVISQMNFMNLHCPEGKLVSFDFLAEEYKESDRHCDLS